jgi:hypothetical protein
MEPETARGLAWSPEGEVERELPAGGVRLGGVVLLVSHALTSNVQAHMMLEGTLNQRETTIWCGGNDIQLTEKSSSARGGGIL